MSSEYLNITRKSNVKVQAYLPFNLPYSPCVFKEGVFGFDCNKRKTPDILESIPGFVLINLFDNLIKCFQR